MSDCEAWQDDHVRESSVVEPSLSLPSSVEARCYQLCRLEHRSQPWVAEQLKMAQSSVSRNLRRAEAKIEALKQSKRFDSEEIDRILRKLTGTAPIAA